MNTETTVQKKPRLFRRLGFQAILWVAAYVAVLAAIIVLAIVMPPRASEQENSLIVHALIPSGCGEVHSDAQATLDAVTVLYSREVTGWWSKTSLDKSSAGLKPVPGCVDMEAADGTHAALHALTTTEYTWEFDEPLHLLVGNRVDTDPTFASPSDRRLRIDQDDVLLGVLDLTGNTPKFTSAMSLDQYRCDRATLWDCEGSDREQQLDALTFAPVD
ncbi:hypothetical protein [Candidatus Poriferisodalis sp.]|uniref:hypothetical protein n=1 Tax=Candidatus Poriferisodalis sp. TaxID=3101277 RepID=UPI003B01E1AD